MFIVFLFYLSFANESSLTNNFSYLKEYLPDNLSKNEDLKSFAIKAYKKALDINKTKHYEDNVYELDDATDLKLELDTSLLFENLKIKLSSNIANLNMSYIAFDNTLNLKLYKNINNDLQVSISEEKKVRGSYEQILFNLVYKF